MEDLRLLTPYGEKGLGLMARHRARVTVRTNLSVFSALAVFGFRSLSRLEFGTSGIFITFVNRKVIASTGLSSMDMASKTKFGTDDPKGFMEGVYAA